MITDFEEAIAALFRCSGNIANSAAKELNTTNIKRKGAAPNRKMGLPVNSLFL